MTVAALLSASYQSAMHPAGPYAAALAHLWWVFAAVCALVWIIVTVLLLAATRKGMRRTAPDESEEGVRRSTRLMAFGIGTTAAILLGLLVVSIAAGRAVSPIGAPVTREIKITGHQWWWQVQYDDAHADRIAEGANEVHLPVGERVRLVLTSSDVIHSFWVPNLHGKRDLIPGKTSVFTIEADAPGIYRGQCAEFCGMQHAHMGLVVIAQPKEEFDAWLANERASSVSPVTADQQRGQQVFLTTSCALCHAIKGTAAGARTGPDLTHVGSRRTLGAAMIPNNSGNLHGWIVNAQSIKPGTLMPPNNFDSGDLHALVAYLESLR